MADELAVLHSEVANLREELQEIRSKAAAEEKKNDCRSWQYRTRLQVLEAACLGARYIAISHPRSQRLLPRPDDEALRTNYIRADRTPAALYNGERWDWDSITTQTCKIRRGSTGSLGQHVPMHAPRPSPPVAPQRRPIITPVMEEAFEGIRKANADLQDLIRSDLEPLELS